MEEKDDPKNIGNSFWEIEEVSIDNKNYIDVIDIIFL